MNSFTRLLGLAALGLSMAGAAFAQDPVKIALVHGISGHSFEAFSKQAQTGFELGIESLGKATSISVQHLLAPGNQCTSKRR